MQCVLAVSVFIVGNSTSTIIKVKCGCISRDFVQCPLRATSRTAVMLKISNAQWPAAQNKQAFLLNTLTLTGNLFLSVQRGHTQGWAAASSFTTGVSLDCLCHAVNFTGARLSCTTAQLQQNAKPTENFFFFQELTPANLGWLVFESIMVKFML